jgi:hypothetical protein
MLPKTLIIGLKKTLIIDSFSCFALLSVDSCSNLVILALWYATSWVYELKAKDAATHNVTWLVALL